MTPTQGKSINIDSTELHTWFERDRAHVELRSKLDDKTIIEWWDESVAEAIEDGFLNPKDYHSSAYEYAKSVSMLPTVPTHYIAMSGSHGCLPDHCEVFNTKLDAVEDLVSLFELGRTRKGILRRDSYLELGQRDGAEYCEITTCNCDNPMQHSDSQ